MTNSQKIELELRWQFGLITLIEGRCATNKLPDNIEKLTIKRLEQMLSTEDESVNISILNVNVARKNAVISRLSNKCRFAEQIKDQDRLLKVRLEKQINKKLNQTLSSQPHGQLMAQAVLNELEDLEFGQYRGPIELFEKYFKQLEPSSNLEEFAMAMARAVFELVKHRDDALQKKLHCSQSQSTPLH